MSLCDLFLLGEKNLLNIKNVRMVICISIRGDLLLVTRYDRIKNSKVEFYSALGNSKKYANKFLPLEQFLV
jgi:hypothetical protein